MIILPPMVHRLMSWRSTTLGVQRWNCSVMRTLVYTWKCWSAQRNWGELHSRVIFALDILCDKSEVRCAQWHAPLPWKKVSFGPHPTPRPARLTAVLGSRSSPHSASVRRWTKQRSLQLVGTCCTIGVPVADRGRLLLDGANLGRTS